MTSEEEIKQQTLAAIAAIWEETRPQYLRHAETLEQAAAALRAGALSAEQREQAAMAAHKIGGALGTFGYKQASQIAKAIERLLENAEPGPQQATELSDEVAALRLALDAPD